MMIQAATKWNKIEYFKKLDENNRRVVIGLEFEENSVEDIYPIQFYNSDKKSYLNVSDKMQEIILSLFDDGEVVVEFKTSLADFLNSEENIQPKANIPASLNNIKTAEFFESYGYQIVITEQPNNLIYLDFNEQLYNDALATINNKKSILVEAIAVLKNGTDFMDFMIANRLDQQSFLIQGYELHLLNIELNNFNSWYILIRSLLCYLLLIVLLLWVIINIYERSNSQGYRVLYYYGFSLSEIETNRRYYYLLKYFPAIISISCLVLGFILFSYFQSYIVMLVFTIYVVIISTFVVLIWKEIKRKIRSVLNNENRKFYNK